MNVPQASLEEVRYYFILARDLGYLPSNHGGVMDVDEAGSLLGGYSRGILASRV